MRKVSRAECEDGVRCNNIGLEARIGGREM